MATEDQIDEVFTRTDDLLRAGEFRECDKYLDKLLHSDDLDILLSGLTSTWAAWTELRCRDALIGRVRSLDDRPGLLDGLIPERIGRLRSETELNESLARLDVIWGAPEGTAEFEERAILSSRIAVYEDQNCYIPKPTPEEAAQFRREQEAP